MGAATLYKAAVPGAEGLSGSRLRARAGVATLGRCTEPERNAHAEYTVGRELAEWRREESQRDDGEAETPRFARRLIGTGFRAVP